MFKMERSNMANRENRKQTKKIAFVFRHKGYYTTNVPTLKFLDTVLPLFLVVCDCLQLIRLMWLIDCAKLIKIAFCGEIIISFHAQVCVWFATWFATVLRFLNFCDEPPIQEYILWYTKYNVFITLSLEC